MSIYTRFVNVKAVPGCDKDVYITIIYELMKENKKSTYKIHVKLYGFCRKRVVIKAHIR